MQLAHSAAMGITNAIAEVLALLWHNTGPFVSQVKLEVF
jgi:hypothetical protein